MQDFINSLQNIFVAEDRIPADARIKAIHQREYLVNGEIRRWDGEVAEVYSPVQIPDGRGGIQRKLIGSYPVCGADEANEALDAALLAYDNGQGEWPTMSIAGRVQCMEKFVCQFIGQRELVIKLLMWEIGKTYTESAKEFDRTVNYINHSIDELKDMDRHSARFEMTEGYVAQVRPSSLGVVLCMGPFNYPLNETFATLIPALLMGNTVLFKPPKHGTLLHYPLLSAFKEAFPKGVVNTIYGRGAVITPGLMASGKINVLAFIGSSKVANELKKQHPKVNRLRAVLSLDAKNAAIVTEHADLKLAVSECILGALSFNGQRCTAIKIIFVHRAVSAAFLKMLAEAVDALKPGLPWDDQVDITPLPEPQKPAYLKNCIDDALTHGASVINQYGGATVGSFVFPAVVYPVSKEMKLYREEQFGPVIPVVPYDSIKEPIAYQVASNHGMQVSIFSNDAKEVSALIDSFVNLVSRVNLNSQCQRGPDTLPFTGRKDSAEGTLSVPDALRSFSIPTMVSAKLNDTNKALINEIVNDNDSNFLSTKYIL
ncbi:NADP-dependent glyceraldehyde-3-phosphate dehydrogenase [Mucilaginibacter phyllosphaerae]